MLRAHIAAVAVYQCGPIVAGCRVPPAYCPHSLVQCVLFLYPGPPPSVRHFIHIPGATAFGTPAPLSLWLFLITFPSLPPQPAKGSPPLANQPPTFSPHHPPTLALSLLHISTHPSTASTHSLHQPPTNPPHTQHTHPPTRSARDTTNLHPAQHLRSILSRSLFFF